MPAYYEKHGGFIFAAAVNLYMYININRPPVDELIRLKYRESEEVEKLDDLKHKMAKAALKRTGIDKMIEVSSNADVPDGTGMGSSASYMVGLLNALHILKGENISKQQLAEEAFDIATSDLGLPDGKQDFYLASFGNFCVLDIAPSGAVAVSNANIPKAVQDDFERRTLLFYTGVRRSSEDILREQQMSVRQNQNDAVELKHQTKRIGQNILGVFENGRLDDFGYLMDEHWKLKRKMSSKMSNNLFDEIYEEAKKNGAFGGKILGAGGGGFFLVYCREGTQDAVRGVFSKHKMKEVPFTVDSAGAQVLLNKPRTHTI
ncbi:MAG: Sugar kinase [Candidatus Giovannonibacteria bacterium GW2011_GWB1_46_20]|uniref:Sugar kinase n=1 Tax=Candidatus Giovannonibacteria bacterium GW2011_GWA1_44_25 TaxID=1618645 RepID=A0A0G1KVT6_9BACT|nr:MAG: Sugar kinase [Parcubacteria group bacterium GW2011_GWC1_44_10]KKT60447.1 MAG: Sugar kinase [Candidatus Giovannonibacteria bacterium GW2011_GWA1_44_25]KKU30305.1 MAG: Sugar kinase [Candidatus Giovannonibacteria bacterium GW2011_GWB1_46_20]